MVLDLAYELDPLRSEVCHRFPDIVAVERDVGGTGRGTVSFGGMDAEVGFRRFEYQPAFADVRSDEPELVSKELPQGLGLGGVEHRMHASNHGALLSGVKTVNPSFSQRVRVSPAGGGGRHNDRRRLDGPGECPRTSAFDESREPVERLLP